VNIRLLATGRDFGGRRGGRSASADAARSGCGTIGVRQNRGMAQEPECHKVEWTRLEIGDRSWRVKLEYG